MKIRNVALTVLAALMGAAGYAQKEHLSMALLKMNLPLSTFIMVIALVAWAAFYFMDRHWYHRLLYGAVKHGQKIEMRLQTAIPEINLTETIGDASPIR